MSPTIFIDFMIALGFIYMFVFLNDRLTDEENRTNDYIKKSKIDQRCKLYLQTVKGNSKTATYAIFISFICSFVMFLALRLLKPCTKMSSNIIYLTTLLTVAVTFGTSYKFINCLMARNLCPGDCGVFDTTIYT